LHRAIAYAIAYKVPFIWIDQECIEQNDCLDKELGIHSMDIVYRRSDHPLGITDTFIVAQPEVDFFAALLIGQDRDRRNMMLDVETVLKT
jgi:Heterokaryon incompatibility protein (HET)